MVVAAAGWMMAREKAGRCDGKGHINTRHLCPNLPSGALFSRTCGPLQESVWDLSRSLCLGCASDLWPAPYLALGGAQKLCCAYMDLCLHANRAHLLSHIRQPLCWEALWLGYWHE